MGLTSAMYTGLTGLNVNQQRVETIGNNIANVNTTAFQGFRTLFETQFYSNASLGTAPSDSSGGTNPIQYGHGALVGTTQRLNRPGALETTGLNTDMAIEGGGYFVVQDAAGAQYYTRDGSFTLNSKNELVSGSGMYVRGYGVDPSYAIVPGALSNISIPIGVEDVARATGTVFMDGDLSAASAVASAGRVIASQSLVSGGGQATDATALTDLRSQLSPGVALFSDGDTITITGVQKGDRELPALNFVVGRDGNTLGDFANWLQGALGIEPGSAATPAGVVVENGQLVVRSNLGDPNAISIQPGDIRTTNNGSPLPFSFTESQASIGDGVFTSLTVFDSLGNAVPVNATFVLESLGAAGPVWRYYLESADPSAAVRQLGSGTVEFDTNGQFLRATNNQVTLDRSAAGAASPLNVTLDFSRINGLSTAASNVIMGTQDGYPAGTLIDWGVGADGVVTGTFSNGVTRTLGQIVVATFSNPQGLVAATDNLYTSGANSGEPAIKPPGELGAGTIRGGALEMSNVDLTTEFIGLISSSTGFQAASRVITTASEMLDQLLLALR